MKYRSRRLPCCLGAVARSGCLLWATSLVACSAAASEQCASDTDCGTLVCNLDTKQCVPRAFGAVGLIEVVPPSGNKQGWVLQEFPAAKPGPDAELLLRLEEALSIEGQVFASHAPDEPIPAQITARRPSLLPGRPEVQVVASTDPSADHRFVLWLEGGHEYTFFIKPMPPYEERYPPRVVTIALEDHLKRDFLLDGDDRAIAVEGRVVNAVGRPLPFSVQVRAYRSNSWIRSTAGRTCSAAEPTACPGGTFSEDNAGLFAIRIPPGVEPYTLRVEPVATSIKNLLGRDPLPLVPTMECSGKVLGLVETNKNRQQQRIATPIKLPAFAYAKLHTASVAGGSAGATEPVAGVQVKFSTSIVAKAGVGFEACQASFSQTGITDAEGKLQLALLPGDTKNRLYQVTTISPAASRFASQYLTAEIGASGGVLQTIVLADRYSLSGSIVDPAGLGVAGATIEARGIETTPLDQSSAGLPPGKATATTSDRGQFVLHVDPGIYNLHIRPPEASGLPQFGLDKRSVVGPVEGLVLRAPTARVLPGRVIASDGKPAVGFMVNSYQTVTDSLSTEQAVLRAYSVSDSNGRFRLLLAP